MGSLFVRTIATAAVGCRGGELRSARAEACRRIPPSLALVVPLSVPRPLLRGGVVAEVVAAVVVGVGVESSCSSTKTAPRLPPLGRSPGSPPLCSPLLLRLRSAAANVVYALPEDVSIDFGDVAAAEMAGVVVAGVASGAAPPLAPYAVEAKA